MWCYSSAYLIPFLFFLFARFNLTTAIFMAPLEGSASRRRVEDGPQAASLPVLTRRTSGRGGAGIFARQDAQSSLTLDPAVIAKGFTNDGMSNKIRPNQIPSLTSQNNFINFCETVGNPLTTGQKNESTVCVPTPMGAIPSIDRMPSLKITFPLNGAILTSGVVFSVTVNVTNFNTGNIATSATNYLSAPQQLSSEGEILGHIDVIIEDIGLLNSEIPSDPQSFAFTKSLAGKDNNGLMITPVDGGLPAGFYRVTALAVTANYQPVLVPVVQHGSLNDAAYFVVSVDGKTEPARSGSDKASDGTTFPSLPNPAFNPEIQTSTTLEKGIIVKAFQSNGLADSGHTASLTSSNNYINYCRTTPNLPITNGNQIQTGSCNPAPLGILPSMTVMPSAKFGFPTNGASIMPNNAFTIKLNTRNLATGMTVNPETNFASAPQQLDSQGRIMGHAHVVIEELQANQTSTTDPRTFAFFAEMDQSAKFDDFSNTDVLSVDVTQGLPSGFYRMSSIVVTANHQPVILPNNQHGSMDDIIFFTVIGDPSDKSANTIAASTIASQTSVVSVATSAPSASSANGTADNSSGTGPSHSDTSKIVGGVLGPLLGVSVLLILVLLYRRRKASQRQTGPFTSGSATTLTSDQSPMSATPAIAASIFSGIAPYAPASLSSRRYKADKVGVPPEEDPRCRDNEQSDGVMRHTSYPTSFYVPRGPESSSSSGGHGGSTQPSSFDRRSPRRDTATSVAPSYHTVEMNESKDTSS